MIPLSIRSFTLFLLMAAFGCLSHATEISILGYHEFTEKGSATQMRLPVAKFRQQMQMLKDSKIEVISMADFLAWKRGEKILPDQAVVITIDDGWKSTYTLAYPILKEFNYPFTVFLYTNYIDVGGRSMSSEMIKDMLQNGGTIGSHSISHPFPSKVKAQKRKGEESYKSWLDNEIGESKKLLITKFGEKAVLPVYAYPGGFFTPEMFDVGADHDYQGMFTVMPKLVTFESSDFELPRFIVLGTHDNTFTNALRFSSGIFDPNAPVPFPGADAHITDRRPQFQIKFPNRVKIDPKSIRLNVSELGDLSLEWDAKENLAFGRPVQSLRSPSYEASLSYKLRGSDELKTMNWTFYIDREIIYTPEIDDLPDLPEPELEPLNEK